MSAPAIPPSAPYTLPYYGRHLDPAKLAKWRKALSNCRRGAGPARMLCIGDSTTRGSLSLASVNDYSMGYPAQLARYTLPAHGLTGNWNSTFPSAAVSMASYALLDARVSFSGGGVAFGASNSQYSIGGNMVVMTAAGSMTFTPTDNVDTFKVYYAISNSTFTGGSFSWAVDAGSTTNVSTNGANAVGSTVIPAGALGAHSLTLAWVSNQVDIIGIEAYDSTKVNSTVSILNAGVVASTGANWNFATYPWHPIASGILTALAPALTVVDLGINEELNSISISTYTTNMQAIITAALAVGDVVLKCHTPDSASTAAQTATMQAINSLAASNNIEVIDLWQRWGSNTKFSTLNGLGYYGDTNHPAAVGYGDVAETVGRLLLAA